MIRALALATAAIVFVACSATDAPDVPTRTCGLRVWHRPASAEAHVEVVGDWNDWKRPGVIPTMQADGWRVAALDVPAGEHAYAIVEDGTWLTDRNEPMTGVHEGREVTVATALDCQKPALRVDAIEKREGGALVRATFLSAQSKKPIDAGSILTKSRDGASTLKVVSVEPSTGKVELDVTGLSRGKYTYTLDAKDEGGVAAEDARAIVWVDGAPANEPFDPHDAIVYQIMVDRFRGPNGALDTPATPSARAGGTLSGVRNALESGELEALGVNTLWLTPLYTNPTGEFIGNDGRLYSSYHGYWPIDSRGLDPRITNEQELDAFVKSAHERGVRVLFDVVPNHVHEQHPYAKAHSAWFKEDCLCGQGTCDWGNHIKTCWFAPYLPDFDWTQREVSETTTADVMWWFDRFDADGIRIDAVPMMPRAATRRIATMVRRRYEHRGHTPYILGENFTGPGGYQSLRYDLGPYGLDGSFHFPLMWTLREAIAVESSGFDAIDASFRAGEEAWSGSGAVMGLMIGNHDVSRFASVSAGNADGDAWTGPPQPIDPLVYQKQRVALATVLTLPGAPVLYYGDEVGLAGRSDPDCRRVMPAEDALIAEQIATRDLARKIGRTRACSRALRRGGLITLVADRARFVFARNVDAEVAIVALTRRPTTAIDAPLPKGVSSALFDVTNGQRVDVASGALRVEPDAFGVHVYVAAESACAP